MTNHQNPMFNGHRLKLGIFSPNCSSGMAVTKIPERWDASWDNNLKLARLADASGIEFLLPIARWSGYGGETDFHGASLETITWCAALLQSTERIGVFATAHTAFLHPVLAAKQFATMDQIGRGRFGLNVVCGWNKPEYEMFGLELPDRHEVRYALAQEWLDIIRRLWTSEERFDWDGQYFALRGVYGNPKPYAGVPPIMNAGSSAHGRAFAARNADFLFTVLVDLDQADQQVADIKRLAREQGRDVGVFTTSYVVCRPTRKEAEAYHDYYANQNADWVAVDRLMALQVHTESFPPEAVQRLRQRFAGGHGVYPLIGDPDDVADGLARISAAGFAGTTVAFVDYLAELPFFIEQVLPRLEAKGLRLPAP